MITFSLNDTIHYISTSNTVEYGVCVKLNKLNDVIVSYDVKTPTGYITTVMAEDAYPNAYSLVTPTPTPTISPSISVSSTPKPTVTPTMTVSPTPIDHPNIFTIDSTGWVSTNGIVTTDPNNSYILFKSTSTNKQDKVIFTKTFTVTSESYYFFNLDFEQGTIRHAKINIVPDGGMIFQMDQTEVNSNNKIVFSILGDSGNIQSIVYIDGTTSIKVQIEFFLDSNYKLPAPADLSYRFTNTILRQITNKEQYHIAPSPSPTPTITLSTSPTPTPSLTSNIGSSGYSKDILIDGPLIYYKLDELTGLAAVDYSGNNINGTYNGVVLGSAPLVNGPGYAASFGENTSITSFIKSNIDNRYQSLAGNFSLELSLNTSSSDGVLVELPSKFKLYNSDGILYFDLYTTSSNYTVNSVSIVNDSSNKLINIVRNESSVALYLNGSIISTIPIDGDNIYSPNSILIGGVEDDNTQNYVGILDDFILFDYAITEEQIKSHYAFWIDTNNQFVTPTPSPSVTSSTDGYKTSIISSKPIAYYRLNESSGTIVYDSMGKHNGRSNGRLILQQPSLLNNYADASTASEGNGLITVPGTDFSFTTNDFTFEFYLKVSPNQKNISSIIFGKVIDVTQATFSYVFKLLPTGKGNLVLLVNGQQLSLITPFALNDDVVRLIDIVRNSRNVYIYANGVQIASGSLPGSGALDVGNSNLEIFSSSAVQNSDFIGTLDEFAIYDFALNPSVISDHYTNGIHLTPTPTPTQTVTPSLTPTQTVTPTISLTPSNTPTPSITPSITVSNTRTPLISITPSPTMSMTPQPNEVVFITDGYSNDFSSNHNGFYDCDNSGGYAQSDVTINGYNNYNGKNSTIIGYMQLTSDQTLSLDVKNNLNISTWSYTETVYSTATTRIYIDNVLKEVVSFTASKTRSGSLTPTSEWTRVNIFVPAGSHTLTIVNEVPTFRSSQETTYSTLYNRTLIDNVVVGIPITPSPTPSSTTTPTQTPTPTRTITVTPTRTATSSVTPTVTRTSSSAPIVTITATKTSTPTPTPSSSAGPVISDGYSNNFSANMYGFNGATLSTTSNGNPGGSIYTKYIQNGNGTTDASVSFSAKLNITNTQTFSMDVLNDLHYQVYANGETVYSTAKTNVYVDGVLKASASYSGSEIKGHVPTPVPSWSTLSFDIEPGIHTLVVTCETPTITSSYGTNYSYVYTRTVVDNVSLVTSTSVTPTPTPTITHSASVTPTISLTPTNTPSVTPTSSISPTVTPTPSVTASTVSETPGYLIAGVHSGTDPLYAYKNNNDDTFTALSKLTSDTSIINAIEASPDGKYIAVGWNSVSTPLYIYQNNNDGTFTKLVNPEQPLATVFAIAFSPNGKYMIVTTSSGTINVYQNNNDGTFTKLASPSVQPTSQAYSCNFSSDGNYLAVGWNSSSTPLYIYQNNNDGTFTKLANPSIEPTVNDLAVAFSKDGTYLVVGLSSATTPIYIYKNVSGTFTKINSPSILPPTSVTSIEFSTDNNYFIACSASATTPIYVYSNNNDDTFTKMPDPIQPVSGANVCRFTNDGKYLAVGCSGTSSGECLYIYKYSSGTFTQLPFSPSITSTLTIYRNSLTWTK